MAFSGGTRQYCSINVVGEAQRTPSVLGEIGVVKVCFPRVLRRRMPWARRGSVIGQKINHRIVG